MPNGTESSKSFGNINYGATTWLLRSASVTFYSGATRGERTASRFHIYSRRILTPSLSRLRY